MSLKRALVLIVLVLVIIFLVFQLTGCRDERALFASEITIERTEMAQGEDITVSVRITNTGESDGDQTIRLDFGDNRNVDYFRATLSPGERVDEELNYIIPTDYPYGDVEVTVRSQDDSDTATITIVGEPDPAFLEVEILEVGGEPPTREVTVEGNIALEHNFRDSKVTESVLEFDTEEDYEKAKIEEVPNQYIVKYADGALDAVREKYNVVDTLESFGYALIEMPEVVAMIVDENVVSFEKNMTAHTDDYVLPNVGQIESQWDKFAMRLPQAWRTTTGDADVSRLRPSPEFIRVAIIDTGIHATHRELGDYVNVDEGWDVAERNRDTHDYYGHGTHVAGIVAANNHHEVVGTMWQAELIPVKMFSDDFGTGVDSFRIGKGMAYAAGYEVDGQQIDAVDVLNMSVSGGDSSYMQDIATTIYEEKDTIMVTSAGNSGSDGLTHPGTYDEVISVGSLWNQGTDRTPVRSNFSSYGPELNITAPGSFITSLSNSENRIVRKSGTSMSSPNVTGVVGLMLANGIDPADVEDILYRTAIDLGEPGWDEEHGHGMVNAYWAVNAVSEINISIGNYETAVDITDDSYTISNIPEGEYQLTAWIDVRNNGIIENGDYVAQKDITLTEDKTIDVTLEEFYRE